jgi:outer membrane protein TolC
MIEVQRAAKVDLLRTQVRLAELNQRIVAANNLLSILRRTLVNLLGLRNSNYKMRINGQLTLDTINPDLSESIKRAYAGRADYLAMERQIAAQRHRVEIARAGHWPIISLEASYGFRSALNPSTRPSSEEQTEDVGFFGVTADWPIFEGGRIDAKIRKERAKLDSLREQFRKLKLQIQLDVETAILNIKSAKEKVKATEASIAQAKESLRIEREKYTEGRGSITDVLDAQSALLDAQTNHYRAKSSPPNIDAINTPPTLTEPKSDTQIKTLVRTTSGFTTTIK